MRIKVKPLKKYPWYLRFYFWIQKRKFGSPLEPSLLWGTQPRMFFPFSLFYGALNRRRSPLDPELRSLVQVRVSQMNWCDFCVDLNAASFVQRGGSLRKLEELKDWEKSNLFDNKERTVLEYAETMTYTDEQVTDELMERIKNYFNENEIIELTALISFQNMSAKFNAALGAKPQGFCVLHN